MSYQVDVWAEEKVGLPNYSNVTIGTRVSKTFADDVPTREAQNQLAQECESFVAEERQAILESIQAGK